MKTITRSAIFCLFAFCSINIAGQSKPFPQNVTYPYGYKPTSLNSDLACKEYNKLMTSFLVECGGDIRPTADTKDCTYSESVGYCMLVAAYQGDKTTYDKLLNFYKLKRSSAANNMMAWKVSCEGIVSSGSSSDADIDVAFSLIVAHEQWKEQYKNNYLEEAKTIIGTLKNSVLTNCAGTYVLKPGYGYGGCNETSISHYTPAFFRIFAQLTGDNTWSALADDTYTLLNRAMNPTTGLVPDWQTVAGGHADFSRSWNYKFDACRVPWRIALDYLWNGNSEAQQWCARITNWANGKGAANIVDGYTLDGTPIGAYNNSAFVGAFAVGAMCNSQAVTDTFSTRITKLNESNYYVFYLRLIYLHVLTGNFWKPNLGTDVPSVANPALKIYPNPSSNQITIEGLQGFEKLEILGINGIVLQAEQIHAVDKVTLSIQSLDKGEYLLKVTDKTGVSTCLKFIR